MSEEKEATTLDIDVAEWQEALGLPEDTEVALVELAQRFDALNRRYGELLVYMNMVDQRVQALAGEKQVTTSIHQHVGSDGIVELSRSRPEAPDLAEIRNPGQLETEEPSRLAKMVATQ